MQNSLCPIKTKKILTVIKIGEQTGTCWSFEIIINVIVVAAISWSKALPCFNATPRNIICMYMCTKRRNLHKQPPSIIVLKGDIIRNSKRSFGCRCFFSSFKVFTPTLFSFVLARLTVSDI